MSEKPQFDELLGGSESLPHEVHTLKLLSSRASEIAAMTYSIDNPQRTKLIFQKLPIHMRRRVMSHNAKRLPRRLREAHIKQMAKSGLPPKSKRPSRKYRRRPRDLLSEYNRRKKKTFWLETHIWHAKRFHMIEKWGCKIADRSTQKRFRTNYRAITQQCLLQDISYYCCIEIKGPSDLLKAELRTHCNTTEITFAAKLYSQGSKEGTLMFFKRNRYPHDPIGTVNFMWNTDSSDKSTIWIWAHPSFYKELLTEIIESFGFEEKSEENFINDKNFQMGLLKGRLNRFRLCGPSALNVLTDALSITKLPQQNHDTWFDQHYRIPENEKTFNIQYNLWDKINTLSSASQLPPNMVFGLTVLDPRFHLPNKRSKIKTKVVSPRKIVKPPIGSNQSPIWEEQLRQRIAESFVPDAKINKMRSDFLVPGICNDENINQDIMSKIPILVVQKPAHDDANLISAIDVILPSNWGMTFWCALTLRCAKVGGLRESTTIIYESGYLRSPDINEPDTKAYEMEALQVKRDSLDEYFRYPPNRRVNFIKLGVPSPFYCEWKMLTKEWSGEEKNYYILRDLPLLLNLKQALIDNKLYNTELVEKLELVKNCLVRTKITLLNKGCPKKFAMICLPIAKDIEMYEKDKRWGGPIEKLNKDPNESQRKRLRRNHLVFLKRCRRKKVNDKKIYMKKLVEIIKSGNKNLLEISKTRRSFDNKEIIREQFQKMSTLCLPNCVKVRQACDREIMGFLTMAGFSFSQAKGIGIGYVTMNSLLEFMNNKYGFVLVRNIQTRQYRIAKLEILVY